MICGDESMTQENSKLHPKHIAIIMDGNGRWAKERGLKRSEGHDQGMINIQKISREIIKYEGVKVLTLYAFSTENWHRPILEVNHLMNLPGCFFKDFMPEIQKNNIRIKLTGFPNQIPRKTRKVVEKAAEETKNNTGCILNFAFNYGGRQEIVDAAKRIAEKVKKDELEVADIDLDLFDAHLLNTQSTQPYQDIDLLIRTSGEERLSNFLLWHNAYSEFYFTDAYWPDFDQHELKKAIDAYQNRSRRFGGI